MEIGSLLQYKRNHYAKYYSKVPHEETVLLFDTVHDDAFSHFHNPQLDRARKKYTLLLLAKKQFNDEMCYYCLITDPHNRKMYRRWVSEKWVETITDGLTYQKEMSVR